MNDYCVLYDHQHCRLSIATLSDAMELNSNRFLNDEAPLGLVRMYLERDDAARFVNAYTPFMDSRIARREKAKGEPK